MSEPTSSRQVVTGSPTSTFRVLVEAPDGPDGADLWRILRECDYEVSWCPGPEGPPAAWCPLMSGRGCDLVLSADVVVSALGSGVLACREVLGGLASLHPDVPVIVVASGAAEAKTVPVLARKRVVSTPVSKEALIEAIESVRENSCSST